MRARNCKITTSPNSRQKHNNFDLCVGMIFMPRNDYEGQEQSRTIKEYQ